MSVCLVLKMRARERREEREKKKREREREREREGGRERERESETEREKETERNNEYCCATGVCTCPREITVESKASLGITRSRTGSATLLQLFPQGK